MKQQDKLRTTLREYYDNKNETFDAHEWERASALINSAKRKRKVRYALLFFTTAFSILGIAFLNVPTPAGTSNLPASAVSGQNVKAAAVAGGPVSTSQPINGHKTPVSFDLTRVDKTQQNFSGKNFSVSSTVKPPHLVRVLEPGEQKNSSPESTLVDTAYATAALANSASVSNQNTISSAASSLFRGDSTAAETMASLEAETTDTPQKQIVIQEAPQEPFTNVAPISSTFSLSKGENEIVLQVPLKPGKVEETASPAPTDSLQNNAPVNLAGTDGVQIADSLPAPPSINMNEADGFFYEAGIAGFYGWKGPLRHDARGLSPVAGINYINHFNSRSAFSFGLQYLQVPNLSGSSKTSRVSSYTYGEYSMVTVIQPLVLHYLSAPLRVNYFAGTRNCFGSGINLSYLLNVYAKVSSYEEGPGYVLPRETTKLSGYTEGFLWYDVQLLGFYRRRINRWLGVQAELLVGLVDVKHDSFFDFKGLERNSGLKLSLIYYTFRKNTKQ